jgi:hypothetical protein
MEFQNIGLRKKAMCANVTDFLLVPSGFFPFARYTNSKRGHAVAQLVEALRYNFEGGRFNFR